MSIFEQLQAAESELERLRTVEAAEVNALWKKARDAGRNHDRIFDEWELEAMRLRKEWVRANTVMRCG